MHSNNYLPKFMILMSTSLSSALNILDGGSFAAIFVHGPASTSTTRILVKCVYHILIRIFAFQFLLKTLLFIGSGTSISGSTYKSKQSKINALVRDAMFRPGRLKRRNSDVRINSSFQRFLRFLHGIVAMFC